jgi:hypothetical protein
MHFDKQALDRWIEREDPSLADDDDGQPPPEVDVPDVYDQLQAAQDALVATRHALAEARADLVALAGEKERTMLGAGLGLAERLAHIDSMPRGFCYCGDCANATSIRILARIWTQHRAKENAE